MNVAFIPVRGGSKSIPRKNSKLMAGKPLVYWATKAASECPEIDKVYVCTDSVEIREAVAAFDLPNVEVVGRSEASATDIASTELAMIEFAHAHAFENIVLIQATSPLITASDLQNGFESLRRYAADGVLSVVRQKRFVWTDADSSFAEPQNYDYANRPRRQDFDGFLVENGAFYITSRDLLLKKECRLSGNIKTVEMPPESYIELDEPEDWAVVEALLLKRERSVTIPEIKLFLTDCDGTLTDAGMYYSPDGEAMKKFNTRDGVGLRVLKEKGIIVGIITGEESEIVRKRAQKLNVDELLMGVVDKVEAILKLCEKYDVSIKNVAYIGDDWNDIEAIRAVGFGICVHDAAQEVRKVADYITTSSGGQGAVREIADIIL
ncbi:MAG: N-acylneuraminate cytidylyltransferase [Clostridiales bacterium]|nr:N-acylneuraminate cytidylyltransferase [Clostridiales bacterium]